jgi:hypothetical protein
MNARLIAAMIALTFATLAHAEQKFGRDSVYIGKNDRPTAAVNGPTITRFGRDSVYVTNSLPPSPSKITADTKVRYGRA